MLHTLACSVAGNKFGPDGAKLFADMLAVNTTLQSVECAAEPNAPIHQTTTVNANNSHRQG
jgi:hypothetical protein